MCWLKYRIIIVQGTVTKKIFGTSKIHSDNKWLQFWDLPSITVILSWRTLNNPIYYTVNSKWLLLLPLFHKNQQSSMKVIRLTPPALMEQFYMRLNAVATHLNAISANMGMATIKAEKNKYSSSTRLVKFHTVNESLLISLYDLMDRGFARVELDLFLVFQACRFSINETIKQWKSSNFTIKAYSNKNIYCKLSVHSCNSDFAASPKTSIKNLFHYDFLCILNQ